MISKDSRIKSFNVMILFAIAVHLIGTVRRYQLLNSNTWEEAFISPGWHIYFPLWIYFVFNFFVLLFLILSFIRFERIWIVLTCLAYFLDYLFMPFRTPNYSSVVLSGLILQSIFWGIQYFKGATQDQKDEYDSYLAKGLVLTGITCYFFAGFHKINSDFLLISHPFSPVSEMATVFFQTGKISNQLSMPFLKFLAYGVVLIECLVPTLTALNSRFRPLGILLLICMHIPMITAGGIIEFPWISSSYFPLFFNKKEWDWLLNQMKKFSRSNFLGVAIGGFVGVWFVPNYTAYSAIGTIELMLWGLFASILVRLFFNREILKQTDYFFSQTQ